MKTQEIIEEVRQLKERLTHRLKRLSEMRDDLMEKHKGKETTVYNYYAGFELGHLIGKIGEIEDQLEEFRDEYVHNQIISNRTIDIKSPYALSERIADQMKSKGFCYNVFEDLADLTQMAATAQTESLLLKNLVSEIIDVNKDESIRKFMIDKVKNLDNYIQDLKKWITTDAILKDIIKDKDNEQR